MFPSFLKKTKQKKDGVTGTEKQFVSDDYKERLNISSFNVETSMALMTELVNPNTLKSKNGSFAVQLFNNLAWYRQEFVNILVNATTAVVTDSYGNKVAKKNSLFFLSIKKKKKRFSHK